MLSSILFRRGLERGQRREQQGGDERMDGFHLRFPGSGGVT